MDTNIFIFMNKNLLLWKYFYHYREIFDAITTDLNFDLDLEYSAAVLLSSVLTSVQDPNIESLLSNIESLESEHLIPIFITLSDSFKDHLVRITNIKKTPKARPLIIAADATGAALMDNGIVPNFVFSDLDGLTANQLQNLTEKGTYIIIHAHGDNMDKIKEFADVIKNNNRVIGTTQTEITEVLINPGGFTDGDRSLFFFHHLLAPNIPFYLLGYNFNSVYVSEYKKSLIKTDRFDQYREMKLKKLRWAEKSIQWLSDYSHRKIFFESLPE